MKNSQNLTNPKLVELIGIILGDGSIGVYPERGQYQLDIALNKIDEPQYVIHVINLMENIFNTEVNIVETSVKGVSLRVYRKNIIQFLLNLGLEAGSKSKHQVSVPRFIYERKELIKASLKGLFDTDGSISIDSKSDLRIRFTNCSKPLIEDFYELCLKLNIIPSPSFSYNSKRNSWQVMIAKKDSIKTFFTLISPQKLKEPFRRLWIASQVTYLNSDNKTLRLIEKDISKWKKKTKQKSFRFSKENAYFLKNSCEKHLKIKIDNDHINKAISRVLKLKKFMFTKKRAKKLKYLYEKLRSPSRIIKYLIDLGEINIPYRLTITHHLKRYFKKINKNYDLWLEKFPLWRIGAKNEQINYFPKELRNILIMKILEILRKNGINMSNFKIKILLEENFVQSNLLIMSWLKNSTEFSTAIDSYIDSLIHLMKKLLDIKINKKSINYTKLSRDNKIPFNRRTIALIIEYLNNKKLLTL